MSEPGDETTLTDDEIETRTLDGGGAARPLADTGDDSGDDSGDTGDTSDTGDDSGDDSGDVSDTSDTGDDSAAA